MPSFAISQFIILIEPLWVPADFLLLSTGPLSYLIDTDQILSDFANDYKRMSWLQCDHKWQEGYPFKGIPLLVGGPGWNWTNDVSHVTVLQTAALANYAYWPIWRRAQNSNLTSCGAICLAGGPQTFWVHSPSMAGVVGFEPTNAGVRDQCLDLMTLG